MSWLGAVLFAADCVVIKTNCGNTNRKDEIEERQVDGKGLGVKQTNQHWIFRRRHCQQQRILIATKIGNSFHGASGILWLFNVFSNLIYSFMTYWVHLINISLLSSIFNFEMNGVRKNWEFYDWFFNEFVRVKKYFKK